MANYVPVNPLEVTGDNAVDVTTKTYHGVQIVVNNVTVGRISSYTSPARSRTVTAVRELSPDAFGRVIEQVPGVNDDGDYKLSISRAEVWSNEMEIAFGFPATFIDLIDQTNPFSLEERLYRGGTLYQTWIYNGCWFSNLGLDAWEASGDAIVKLQCEIVFTSRQKTTGNS